MKNKIIFVVRAVSAALCFLTAFFGCTGRVHAESGQMTHCHTGSRQNGGGCYGTKKTETAICGSYNVHVGFNGTNYIYTCGQCGNEWNHQYELSGARCHAEITATYYETNCGRDGAAAVSFSVEPSTRGWTKELDLTASYSVHEDGVSISGFTWNGSPGGAEHHVTENGTYQLGLAGSGNVDFSKTVSITIDHVDHTPPQIGSFQAESEAWQSSVELLVSASDSESGLAAQAYSFDGGVSWGEGSAYTVAQNGTYCVSVRDAVGNISTAETTVGHIDTTPPVVSVSTSPSVNEWYEGSLNVSIHAQDTESGLADAPYSFDGGAAYLVGNSITLSKSGALEIAVKDKAGNVARISFRAEKKQRPQPTTAPGGGSNSGNGGHGSGDTAGNTGAGHGGNGTSQNGESSAGSNAGFDGGTPNMGSTTAGTGLSGDGLENGAAGNTGAGNGEAAGGGSIDGNAGSGNADRSTGGNTGAGNGSGSAGIISGNGSTGRGNSGGEGNQNRSGNAKGGSGTMGNKRSYESGKGNGLGGMLSGKDGESRNDDINGDLADAAQTQEGGMRQHYPDSLPRIESMTDSGSEEMEAERDATVMGSPDAEMDGTGTEGNGTDTAGAKEGESIGFGEEEAVIQNELLASAGAQEAAMLQKAGNAVNAGFDIGSIAVLSVCAAVLAAAVLWGWVLLFGIRIDTRDEKGYYRFAGITRVTVDRQEKLRVVPLTKQIIRNSRTNALRIRFGLLSHKLCAGETLLLRYRSMKREFEAERTVELHIRA